MSWDSYVDALLTTPLTSGGNLTSAAVVGQDGGVWAKSANFPEITVEQITAIMNGFKSIETNGHAGELGSTGIRLGDVKFQVAPGDETVIRGKSKGGGCCIKRSNTALVIGVYDEPVPAGDCNIAVENMGDYLKSMDY